MGESIQKVESYTEAIIRAEMEFEVGANPFGMCYPQGNLYDMPDIMRLLSLAGGKPASCALMDAPHETKGRGKPEYILTFASDRTTILVIECKRQVSKHVSPDLDKPRTYAVDGVLYYAKFLKEAYNVIALGVSGTSADLLRVDAYYWPRGISYPQHLDKATDVCLEPQAYLNLIHGQKLVKKYSLEQIRQTAQTVNARMREAKITEKDKPIFVAGILIALEDDAFAASYDMLPSFDLLFDALQGACSRILESSGLPASKVHMIVSAFNRMKEYPDLRSRRLGSIGSLSWHIHELEMKIEPMMRYPGSTVDALGVFYQEFIRYTGGDGKALGIVLTPTHLTEFMARLIGITKYDRVLDTCCGSASFLITCMGLMYQQYTEDEKEEIRTDHLFGVEIDPDIYFLAITNMIVRGDGKSNIQNADCFDGRVAEKLKQKGITAGLINPPYAQGTTELEYVERLLDIVQPRGKVACIVPTSCALGKKHVHVRERLMKRHRLDAVFSMPDDLFYPTGVTTCVMVWEAHRPHNKGKATYFGYCKDDGLVKVKNLGRVDRYARWSAIQNRWLALYAEREVEAGSTAKKRVGPHDEWVCEAYMQTDPALMSIKSFDQKICDYAAHLIREKHIELDEEHVGVVGWKPYRLGDLFTIRKGSRLTRADMNPGHTRFLGAIESNNAIRDYIDTEPEFEAHTITVNYNGSVGYAFYQDEPYCATDDINVLSLKDGQLDEWTGLFVCAVLQNERYRFSYGRKWTKSLMENSIIWLPSDDAGNPDWVGMRGYMLTLPHASLLQG